MLVLMSGCKSNDSKSVSEPANNITYSLDRESNSNNFTSEQTLQFNEDISKNNADTDTNIDINVDDSTALTGTGEASKALSNPIVNQRKIIRNANITVEVDNFDAAYGKVEYIIGNTGYVQESKITKAKHYVDGKEVLVTKGVIIIRVDAEKFNEVLKDIKGLGLLTEENIKTDDVTSQFFDVESRLRLIRYEESRLEEYLKKIEDPDTIFKTESRLTDIRHEIEQLTATLNKLSDLVKLSTITINMNEKLPDSLAKPVDTSYFGKLRDNFLESLFAVIDFLGNLLIFLVASLPSLLLLAIIFFAGYFLYKKFFKKKTKPQNKENPPAKKDVES
ncbi:MAG: hypothetical protein BWY74_02470 [Firmicutes bacterium ADurb.Bin419]|nr:MAG: hypothetical protein BWY74_02470 [Firmicutes bacterium ADurb.Bin419]